VLAPGRSPATGEKLPTNSLLLDLNDATGFGIIYPGKLEKSSSIEINIGLPNGFKKSSEKNATLQAEVIWHNPELNRYGVRLSDSGSKEDLRKALASVCNTFVYKKTVYLSETNAEGNVYFARFFDWQGEVREAYLKQGITPEQYQAMVDSKVLMVTANASMEYLKMLMLFDPVFIRFTTRNIRRASLEMHFSFFHGLTGEFVGRGYQRLTFQTSVGQIIPIPEPIRKIALAVEDSSPAPFKKEKLPVS